MYLMDKLKWFIIAFVLGLTLCAHAFYPAKIELSSSVSHSASQQLLENGDSFKFIASNQQLRLRLSSVVSDDDDTSDPVLFDLIKTWGGDVLALFLAGLIWLILPLRHQSSSGAFARFPANYWNPKHLQFRFSHSGN